MRSHFETKSCNSPELSEARPCDGDGDGVERLMAQKAGRVSKVSLSRVYNKRLVDQVDYSKSCGFDKIVDLTYRYRYCICIYYRKGRSDVLK